MQRDDDTFRAYLVARNFAARRGHRLLTPRLRRPPPAVQGLTFYSAAPSGDVTRWLFCQTVPAAAKLRADTEYVSQTPAARQHAGVWHVSELQFDPFTHEHMPAHFVCDEAERKRVFERYGRSLPQMHAADPAARALGAKPGDLVRVHRDAPRARGGKSRYWRRVVL